MNNDEVRNLKIEDFCRRLISGNSYPFSKEWIELLRNGPNINNKLLELKSISSDDDQLTEFLDQSLVLKELITNPYNINRISLELLDFYFSKTIIKAVPFIFSYVRSVDLLDLRVRLLRVISDPEIYQILEEAISNNPYYILDGFSQHEIPEKWIMIAIEKNPSLLEEFYDLDFELTEGLCDIFKKNGLYVEHLVTSPCCPYIGYKNAINQNFYALMYTPDKYVIRYFQESFRSEKK